MPVIDTISPRENTTQQVNVVRFGLAFSNNLGATGKMIGSIPAGSFITKVAAHVTVPFNGGTNALSLGTTQANANELLQTGDITAGTAGYQTNARGEGLTYTAVPVPASSNGDPMGGVGLWAKYAQTGAAATQGLVIFVVTYVGPAT